MCPWARHDTLDIIIAELFIKNYKTIKASHPSLLPQHCTQVDSTIFALYLNKTWLCKLVFTPSVSRLVRVFKCWMENWCNRWQGWWMRALNGCTVLHCPVARTEGRLSGTWRINQLNAAWFWAATWSSLDDCRTTSNSHLAFLRHQPKL